MIPYTSFKVVLDFEAAYKQSHLCKAQQSHRVICLVLCRAETLPNRLLQNDFHILSRGKVVLNSLLNPWSCFDWRLCL